MQHFIVWFGFFSIVPPILLNCSLCQPLVHLSSFTCSFVIIFTPEASKRTSLTNLINSSEKTNVYPFHKSGSAPKPNKTYLQTHVLPSRYYMFLPFFRRGRSSLSNAPRFSSILLRQVPHV